MSDSTPEVTPQDVAEANATDMERLLLPVMGILGGISHRNLTSKSAVTDFLVSRRHVMDMKKEVDRQFPGLYEHMRRLQREDGDTRL